MEKILHKLSARPLAAVIPALLFALAGVVSLKHLPLALLPATEAGRLTILTRHPGVAADRIEESITIPIERQISSVSQITGMESFSRDGESRLNLSFAHKSDIGAKILEVSEKLYTLQPALPSEALPPVILSHDSAEQPIFIISFQSKIYDLRKLREIVDRDIKPQYERLRGVSEVITGGGLEREIRISIDPAALNTQSALLANLAKTIAMNDLFLPAGRMGGAFSGKRESHLYVDARLKSTEEIETLSVIPQQKSSPWQKGGSRSHVILPLKQLAKVADSWREPDTISRNRGEDRVALYIYKAGHASALSVSRDCLQTSNQLSLSLQTDRTAETADTTTETANKTADTTDTTDTTETADITADGTPAVTLDIIYNHGRKISQALALIGKAAIYGSILAAALLYLFLRRPLLTIAVALTIPSSLLTSLFLIFLARLNLNIMSLCGLALGVGMLIDSSIVVAERIESRQQREDNSNRSDSEEERPLQKNDKWKKNRERAVLSVKSELLAATFTSIVVFVPLFFVSPETRNLYRDLALAVSFSLLSALFFSLFVLPALLSLLSPLERVIGKETMRKRLQMKRVTAIYLKYAKKPLQHKKSAIVIFALSSFLLPPLFCGLKKEFISPLYRQEILASLHLKSGRHLEHTVQVVKEMEKKLERHRAVSNINVRIEKSRAWFTISLQEDSDIEKIAKELQALTDDMEEGFTDYTIPGEIRESDQLDVQFFGEDNRELKNFARLTAAKIEENLAGVDRVLLRFGEEREELLIIPDREKMAAVAATNADLGELLRYLLSGVVIAKYYHQGEGQGEGKGRQVDLRLKGDEKRLKREEDIAALRFPSATALSVTNLSSPLSYWTEFKRGQNDSQIWRKERRRMAAITVQLNDLSLQAAASHIRELLESMPMPPDISFDFGKSYHLQKENQYEMLTAILLAALLIYLLLAALRESLVEPLFILLTLLPTSLGALIILTLTGATLNMSVYIGLLMLNGIVVNNSILVASAIRKKLHNRRRKEPGRRGGRDGLAREQEARERAAGGKNRRELAELLLSAAASRIRPILITTLTTLLGLLPMVIGDGSNLWQSLALTVGGGLLFAMPASLSVVPFAFYLFYQKNNRENDRKKRYKGQEKRYKENDRKKRQQEKQ